MQNQSVIGPATRKVAALYDIHGNLPALEAVLKDVQQASVDLIIVGGDVFPGPMAGDALALLRSLDIPTQFILGNGDRETLAMALGDEPTTVPEQFRATMKWGAEQLGKDEQLFVASWPGSLRLQIEGIGDVLFCHATPTSDTAIFTKRTPEDRLRKIFANLDASLVVCGHTHMQFDRIIGETRVINAGSVGMPFGEPGAYWLLLDPNCQLRQTRYDLETAARRIKATLYPQANDFATRNVLQPPSEQTILDMFTSAELA